MRDTEIGQDFEGNSKILESRISNLVFLEVGQDG